MERHNSALAGLKVIDLTGGLAAPSAAMFLAQYGANVIKVESPHGGDWARIISGRSGGHSVFSIYCTLGKRSIAIDLKTAEGKEILWRLLKGADVFMEAFRPGTIKRFGFGYEAVSKREPQIIYFSLSGFGQVGPMADRPAMDPVLQAFTGIADENRGILDNLPKRVEMSAIDMFSGLLAFQAIAMALYERKSGGAGRYIETSLMQGAALLSSNRMMRSYLERHRSPTRALSAIFNTVDGAINFSMARPSDWEPFCEAIGYPELAADSRFITAEGRSENFNELIQILARMFEQRPTAWFEERLSAKQLMNGRVNTYLQFLQEEQVEVSGIISWLAQPDVSEKMPVPNIPGLPPFESGSKRAHAPLFGENTIEVLNEYGYSDADISSLLERKIVDVSHPMESDAASRR